MEYAVDLGRGHSVLQDTEGYLFTQDSVVCANLMPAGSRDRLLDLGCGTGVMSVLAVLKKGVREAVGLDVDERACELARKNAEPLPELVFDRDVLAFCYLTGTKVKVELCHPAPEIPEIQDAAAEGEE